MVGEAVQGVLAAKAQKAVSDSLQSIGISDSIIGENRTDESKIITDFAKKLLPKVLLDHTFFGTLAYLFPFSGKTKPKKD